MGEELGVEVPVVVVAVASLTVVVVVVNWMEAELVEASSFSPLAFVEAQEVPWPNLTK